MNRSLLTRKTLHGLMIAAIAGVVVGAAYLGGALRPLDAALLELQFSFARHAATGGLVVVKIDPKSLAALDSWPWPRSDHAILTDRLISAGARLVAFDVDFSSHSSPDQDARLAEAFHAAAGRAVLPVFKQGPPAGSEPAPFAFSAPLELFQRDARLATVTVQPEADGRIWHALTSDLWKGWRLPTMPGLLAGHGSDSEPAFRINYGIDPSTIPQFSYVDILQGRFDPKAIAGKTVIVGATAVELGDRYAVPVYADLPGVIVQALAYETLAQGGAMHDLARLWVLVLTFAIALPAWLLFRRLSWRKGALAGLAIALAIFIGAVAVGQWLSIYVAAAAPIFGVLVAYLAAILQTIDLQALDIFNQQIEAAQRRALMKTVVETSSDGILIANEDGTVSMVNPAAAAMLGCDPHAAVGAKIQTLLPQGDASDAADPLLIGTQGKCDVALTGPDATSQVVEITLNLAAVAPTGHVLERRRQSRNVFIYALHDITERKRVEEAQRAASAAAIANSRAKTEFLTNISHELRTPLNAVIGFAEMIKEEIFGPVGQKRYVDYAKDIHSAGTHLLDVINDILSISRIELGEMKLNEGRIDVAATVDAVLRLIGLRATQKSIAVGCLVEPDLPVLWADERAVKQVLLNVLSNAVKFTDAGGWVQLSAHMGPMGELTIAVADNGIGIAPEALAKVTQPFFQADGSLERRHDGVGLGLSIVRDLMSLHGGVLAIDSEPGVGTTITLTFPAARLLARVAEAVPAAAI